MNRLKNKAFIVALASSLSAAQATFPQSSPPRTQAPIIFTYSGTVQAAQGVFSLASSPAVQPQDPRAINSIRKRRGGISAWTDPRIIEDVWAGHSTRLYFK